jgi:hypothetical protein
MLHHAFLIAIAYGVSQVSALAPPRLFASSAFGLRVSYAPPFTIRGQSRMSQGFRAEAFSDTLGLIAEKVRKLIMLEIIRIISFYIGQF